jgi:hypothetical protein
MTNSQPLHAVRWFHEAREYRSYMIEYRQSENALAAH